MDTLGPHRIGGFLTTQPNGTEVFLVGELERFHCTTLLTLVASESAKEAALSMGLKVGDPVESLALNMIKPAPRMTKTLTPNLLRLTSLFPVNYSVDSCHTQ